MNRLNRSQIAALRESLLSHQQGLLEQLEISKQAAEVVVLDQTSVGRVSRVDAVQQQNIAISTRRNVRLRLKNIAMALQAIANGDYGYCHRCDEPIQFERLKIQPEVSRCLDCQNTIDQQ